MEENLGRCRTMLTYMSEDHLRITSDSLWAFFNERRMVDINVICHGHQFEAHKLVLAVSSPVLKNYFANWRSIPISVGIQMSERGIHLDYVAERPVDISHLIEFVYTGTVTVQRSRVKPLLRVAEVLMVKTLVDTIASQGGPFLQSVREVDGYTTLTYEGHYRFLGNGIWDLFNENYIVDSNVVYRELLLRVHKLVLSVVSPVFRSFLTGSNEWPQCNVVVTILGLHLDYVADHETDVSNLIEFLYRGHVSIAEDRVTSVMNLASKLGVQTLVDTIMATDHKFHLHKGGRVASGHPSNVGQNVASSGSEEFSIESLNEAGSKLNKDLSSWDVQRSGGIHGIGHIKQEFQNNSNGHKENGAWEQSPSTFNGHASGYHPLNSIKREYPGAEEWTQGAAGGGQNGMYDSSSTKNVNSVESVSNDTSAQKKFVCGICREILGDEPTYKAHMVTHCNQNQCPLCPFYSAQKQRLTQHLAAIHRIDEWGNHIPDASRCTLCEYSCSAPHQLTQHYMKKHCKDKPYRCSLCDYATVVEQELEKHVRQRHPDRQKHECPTCGFLARTKTGLTLHARSHERTRPHKCQVCNEGFTTQGKLKIHMQRHPVWQQQETVSCQVCGLACQTAGALQMHVERAHGHFGRPNPEMHVAMAGADIYGNAATHSGDIVRVVNDEQVTELRVL